MAIADINYEPITYPNRLELVMSEHETEWLTLNEAAKRPECPVAGNTLREMIIRGDVPEDCYQKRPFGEKRIIYYIDANCLRGLDYKGIGERGRADKYKKSND